MSKKDEHDKGSHQKSESPLKKIREKELEFGGKYLEAKKQAEMIIADARKKSSEIKTNAKENALKEAEIYYKQKLSLLNKDINKVGDEDIFNVKKLGEKNFNKAYEYLLEQIIPNI